LKPLRVRFTETANHHVDRERAWWLENRDHRDLFAAELEKAVEILASSPELAPLHANRGARPAASLHRKLGCHLYYTFDADDVIVRALWGARRERGPTL
jgi:hypothetical protein